MKCCGMYVGTEVDGCRPSDCSSRQVLPSVVEKASKWLRNVTYDHITASFDELLPDKRRRGQPTGRVERNRQSISPAKPEIMSAE